MEDSQLICAFLNDLDGRPRFHNASHAAAGVGGATYVRRVSLCGVGKWPGSRTNVRRLLSPMSQRAPSAWQAFFEDHVTDRLMQGAMAHLILAVAVEMTRKRGLGDSRLASSFDEKDGPAVAFDPQSRSSTFGWMLENLRPRPRRANLIQTEVPASPNGTLLSSPSNIR
jgi:hypothetical protein